MWHRKNHLCFDVRHQESTHSPIFIIVYAPVEQSLFSGFGDLITEYSLLIYLNYGVILSSFAPFNLWFWFGFWMNIFCAIASLSVTIWVKYSFCLTFTPWQSRIHYSQYTKHLVLRFEDRFNRQIIFIFPFFPFFSAVFTVPVISAAKWTSHDHFNRQFDSLSVIHLL